MQLDTGGMWKRTPHSSETGRSIQVLTLVLLIYTVAIVDFCFRYTNILAYDLMKIALKSRDLSPGTSRGCMRSIDSITQK